MLASASPRRLDLLRNAGLTPRVQPADVDESPLPDEAADAYVLRVARDKAMAIVSRSIPAATPAAAVLAADTAVVLDGAVLGKPEGAASAEQMLRALSGRSHVVLTGVVVIDADGHERSTVVSTTVTMRTLAPTEITAYVAGGEPLDKAGGYAIQGGAAAFVERVEGSWTNVVGLPLDETLVLLEAAGVRPDSRLDHRAGDMEWRRTGNG